MIWHTEIRKISELKNWEDNPRTISKEAYQELKESIDDLGNFEPLVVNVDGTVIAGNQRLRVHIENGDSEVEVSVPERELTEEEIKKIGIISNRHSGEWDMDKLANEFEDVLEELGFDDLMPEVELDVKEDDYEEPEDLPIRVKLGEVWQLGKHRLMCGDSTKIEDVEKLMDGQKADMVFTDPPYALFGNSTGVSGITDDKMVRPFFRDLFGNCRIMTKEFAHIYVCCDWHTAFSLQDMARESGLSEKNLIIWDKGDGGIGSMYQNCYEMVWFYSNKPKQITTRKTKNTKTGERLVNGKSNIWRFNREVSKSRVHNAQKPVDMIISAVGNSSDSDDVVLDLFGGSGSTLIACEQTNRICYMMELDEHYATVILDRWEKLTGEKGVKLED